MTGQGASHGKNRELHWIKWHVVQVCINTTTQCLVNVVFAFKREGVSKPTIELGLAYAMLGTR